MLIKRMGGYMNRVMSVPRKRLHKNEIIFGDFSRQTRKEYVNLHYFSPEGKDENLGDYLSTIVVGYFADLNTKISSKDYRHLYAIGSILGFGYQDAVIWGSGIMHERWFYRDAIRKSKLDVRCVRGPKTREVLLKYGVECPKRFGDPAILMPKIYMPVSEGKRYKISIITHFSENEKEYAGFNRINMLTINYKKVIDEIVASELVISSSLHGIILSESYGVPCIWLSGKNRDSFKYEDYYYSTGRYDIPKARTIDEALRIEPIKLPNLNRLESDLMETFPYDLWE